MSRNELSVNKKLEALELEIKRLTTRRAAAPSPRRILSGVALATILGCALLFQAPPANTQEPGIGIPARVSVLETKVAALESANSDQSAQIAALQTALAVETAARQAADSVLQSNIDNEAAARAAADTTLQNNISAEAAARAAADATFQTRTQFMSVVGTDTFFTGTNLHILNGLDYELSINGLGNLIVGYNLSRPGGDIRTGSHNIIAGDFNDYSSIGGVVVGVGNSIYGNYASVSGGYSNTATFFASSVSGGAGNAALGQGVSISGGVFNTAINFLSSISGGFGNTASGDYSSISGGARNTASGESSSVSGGQSIPQALIYGWSGGSLSGTSVGGNFHSP